VETGATMSDAEYLKRTVGVVLQKAIVKVRTWQKDSWLSLSLAPHHALNTTPRFEHTLSWDL
jgi:hypothetical protein